MLVSVRCPNPSCSQRLTVPADALGADRQCEHCGQRFQPVPSPVPAAGRGNPRGWRQRQRRRWIPPHRPLDRTRPLMLRRLPRTKASQGLPRALTVSFAPGPDDPVSEQIGRFQIRDGSWAKGPLAGSTSLRSAAGPRWPSRWPSPSSCSTEQRVERFLREARAAANLRHPHIVPVFDSGQDGGHYYIASAFIPGQSLAGALEELPQGKGCPAARRWQMVRQLAEALAYAHGRGWSIGTSSRPTSCWTRRASRC